MFHNPICHYFFFFTSDTVCYPAGGNGHRSYCNHKPRNVVRHNIEVGCGIYTIFYWYQGSLCMPRNIPHTLTPHQQPKSLTRGKVDVCFHTVYAKYCSYHDEFKSQLMFFQSSIVSFVWSLANSKFSFLLITGGATGKAFCCRYLICVHRYLN